MMIQDSREMQKNRNKDECTEIYSAISYTVVPVGAWLFRYHASDESVQKPSPPPSVCLQIQIYRNL